MYLYALPALIAPKGQLRADRSPAFSIRYGQPHNPFVCSSIRMFDKNIRPACPDLRGDRATRRGTLRFLYTLVQRSFPGQLPRNQQFAHSLPIPLGVGVPRQSGDEHRRRQHASFALQPLRPSRVVRPLGPPRENKSDFAILTP